jgi:hypothetical protein
MGYAKNNFAGFMGKGAGQRLIGAGKSAVRLLDNDVANGVVTALSPELGMGLAAARKTGLLEKLKH